MEIVLPVGASVISTLTMMALNRGVGSNDGKSTIADINNYTITINSATAIDQFEWALDYISKLESFRENANVLTISVGQATKNKSEQQQLDMFDGVIKKPSDKMKLVPGYGSQKIKYEGAEITIERIPTGSNNSSDSSTPSGGDEFLVLKVDKAKKSSLQNLMKKIEEEHKKKIEDNVVVHIPQRACGWKILTNKKRRPLNTVIFNDQGKDGILDARRWYTEKTKKWYESMCIPWRRGYLLHGDPGSGKTSFVYAVASDLRMNIYMLGLSEIKSDSQLMELVLNVPPKNIILLEDIDCAFSGNNNPVKKDEDEIDLSMFGIRNSNGKVTMSGLLNTLDGMASQESCLVFMTTNHIDKIDPALIRPGRIDKKILFKKPADSQSLLLFKRFFPNSSEKEQLTFAEKIKEMNRFISHAELQGIFLNSILESSPENSKDIVVTKESIGLVIIKLNKILNEQKELKRKYEEEKSKHENQDIPMTTS